MPSSPPSNMLRAKLAVPGLAPLATNALLAWHPRLSLDLPLLIVLFFHGREPDPQNFAWTGHRLPEQIAKATKNAVLVAPTMRMTAPVNGNVVSDYLSSHHSIVTLLREALAAVQKHRAGSGDDAEIDRAIANAGLHLCPYSNGYLAWKAAVKTLRAPRRGASIGVDPPPVIGHSAFDCLYWSTPLMDGVDSDAPADAARFSAKGRALLDTAFVTTHFTSRNETFLTQAKYLDVMIGHDPSLHRHDGVVSERLGPTDIARTVAPISDHSQAVSHDFILSRVIAAVPSFDLPPVRSRTGEEQMTENGDNDPMAGAGSMTTAAFSERDLAHGVTNWLVVNFGAQLKEAVSSTPFSVPLLCAIACREAGSYWLPLTPSKSAAEILGLCVYDASGDVAGAPRSAFPINTAQFRLSYGEDFTTMLIDEANKARAARGLRAAAIVYKGYGIFQYDLQHVRTDEAFFRSRKWHDFSECLARALGELRKKFAATGDIQEAVRAYNGSGPRAEQYARDVMRLLPFCEEAVASSSAGAPAGALAAAAAAAAAPTQGRDDDPAFPSHDDINDTADLDTARVLANLGAPGAATMAASAPSLSTFGTIAFDISRAQAFLDACRTSNPRVTYGLGKKVPFFGAVPGRISRASIAAASFVRR